MESIIKYFIEEKKQTEVVAKVLSKTLMKYDDIAEAFIAWIETREFLITPVVGDYSPQRIHEMNPDLDGAGVYQFLVTLRDNPLKAQMFIDNNFSRK